MFIEPSVPLSELAELAAPATEIRSEPSKTSGTSFSNWFVNELDSVNESLLQADHETQKLATGEVQNLHQVMIRLEEARHSFQLLAQIRNRLLEAYQEVMRMQV